MPVCQTPACPPPPLHRYANPNGYWRAYEAWWAQWKGQYGAEIESGAQAGGAPAAFYSGKEKKENDSVQFYQTLAVPVLALGCVTTAAAVLGLAALVRAARKA